MENTQGKAPESANNVEATVIANETEQQSKATEDTTNNDAASREHGDTKGGAADVEGLDSNNAAPNKKRTLEEKSDDAPVDDEPMPTLPLKKARTAYFIFADEKREELKQLHKGEGVAVLAKATGELWSALDSTKRKEYETKAAVERDRVSKDMQRLKDAGLWPESTAGTGDGVANNDDGLIFPVGRIRKICKLDPDVKGMSKESTSLIAKAAELFCVKLGNECVTMAQMQNRRKLLPEDVVEVCSMKERFMFLKDDIKDLAREQLQERKDKDKEDRNAGGKSGNQDDGKPTVSLLNYFSKS